MNYGSMQALNGGISGSQNLLAEILGQMRERRMSSPASAVYGSEAPANTMMTRDQVVQALESRDRMKQMMALADLRYGGANATKEDIAKQQIASREKIAQMPKPQNQNGVDRGAAMMLGKYFTTSDSNRMTNVKNALDVHNALVDLQQAYQDGTHGDPNKMMTILQSKAAQNPILANYVGSIGQDPSNIIPVYGALRRQAAIEVYKLSTGSTMAPDEKAVNANMAMYPDLGQDPIKSNALLATTAETQLLPIVTGLHNKLGLAKDPKTGAFPIKQISDLYENTGSMGNDLTNSIHTLRGQGLSIMPGGQGGGVSQGNGLIPQGFGAGGAQPMGNGGAQPVAGNIQPGAGAQQNRKPLNAIFGTP